MDLPPFIRGLLLGLGAAAPVGPVNVEIIRRGLTRGFTAALSLGLGACTADMLYLSLVLLGVASRLQNRLVHGLLRLGGGALLLALGLLALRAAWRIARGREGGEPPVCVAPGTPVRAVSRGRAYLTGLGMTLANPMTIAFWIAVAANLAAERVGWAAYGLNLGGVAAGTIGWVLFVSTVSSNLRRWVGRRLFFAVDLLGAAMLIAFGVQFVADAVGALGTAP